jgi:hypothetical protein
MAKAPAGACGREGSDGSRRLNRAMPRRKCQKNPEIPKSGRGGEWVYYMRGRTQCRRRYVKPRDPRTAKQLAARARLGASSKEWSQGQALTESDRAACGAVGGRIKSRTRLGQWGWLTGQQWFVKRVCAGGAWSVEREAAQGGDPKAEGRRAEEGRNPMRVGDDRRGVCGVGGWSRGRRGRSTWEWCRSGWLAVPSQCRECLGLRRGQVECRGKPPMDADGHRFRRLGRRQAAWGDLRPEGDRSSWHTAAEFARRRASKVTVTRAKLGSVPVASKGLLP